MLLTARAEVRLDSVSGNEAESPEEKKYGTRWPGCWRNCGGDVSEASGC